MTKQSIMICLEQVENNMELRISKPTNTFKMNWNAFTQSDVRFIVNQGGTRSGKSYAIMQILVICAIEKKRIINVLRSSATSHDDTSVIDFVDIMETLGIYNEDSYNKTKRTYTFENGSTINFISPEKKLKGRHSDIVYMNEADELSLTNYVDINVRLQGDKKIFIDYNPSDNENWIYDLIDRESSKDRDKLIFIKSTYKDNRYLDEDQVKEIEELMDISEEWYKSYALGERPVAQSRIYRHFRKVNEVQGKLVCYGLDCGMGHPTALVSMYEDDNKYYFNLEFFGPDKTAPDLVKIMNELGIDKTIKIYSDHQPYVTEELKRAGYKVENADKQDVLAGINCVKSNFIFITESSKPLWSEYKTYSWKIINDSITDIPVKINDDAIDALRYALYTYKKKGKLTGKLRIA